MAQTKGAKKMEKAVVVEGEKEVGFGELELKIQKPALNADKTLSISGNFEELGNKIQKVVDKYKNEVLTEENVGYIKNLKSQFVSLRTGIERERREYKKVYLDPATKLINAMCDELQKIVAEGENALGAQLDAYDQRRKDELTVILNEYKDEAAAKHNLRDEYKDQIQLIDKYYNKTQNEEDSADDIERQAAELEKKQKEYDSGVALITTECNDAELLPDAYLRELQYKSAMEIILEIKQDKKTRDEMKAKEAAGEKIVIGEPITEELKKAVSLDSKEDKEEENKTRVVRIVYKPENAKKIAQAMKELCISVEFLNPDSSLYGFLIRQEGK